MPIEAATYISDLNPSNPVGSTDKVQTLDDHIRLIKSTLKTTFPSITGAVTATHTELNVLDGISATTAELNQLAGAASGAGMVADIAALTDANADRLLFWDDSAGAVAQLAPDGTTIAISGTTLATGSNVPLLNASNAFSSNMSIAGNLTMTGNIIVPDDFSLVASGGSPSVTFDSSGGVLALVAATSITLNGVASTEYARKGVANTFTTAQTIADNTANPALSISTSNAGQSPRMALTSSAGSWLVYLNPAATTLGFYDGTADRFTIANGGNFDFKGGTVTRANASAAEVGYAGAPSRAISGSTNTAATDAGKTIVMNGGSGQTFTLDGDPPTDSLVYLVNTSGANWTIAASGTLHSNTGTGSRTLIDHGMALAVHLGSGNWSIVGVLA